MMVIANGRVISTYGDTAHVSKSILAILVGRYVLSGKLALHKA